MTAKVADKTLFCSRVLYKRLLTRPLPVPAGMIPNVVCYINSSLSSRYIRPLTISWKSPSPEILITLSYCLTYTSSLSISYPCILLSVCLRVISRWDWSSIVLASSYFLGALPAPPNGFKRAKTFRFGGSSSLF